MPIANSLPPMHKGKGTQHRLPAYTQMLHPHQEGERKEEEEQEGEEEEEEEPHSWRSHRSLTPALDEDSQLPLALFSIPTHLIPLWLPAAPTLFCVPGSSLPTARRITPLKECHGKLPEPVHINNC